MLDWGVIFIYLALIFGLAYISRRKESLSDCESDVATQQYLAGKSLTLWESMGSIIATEVSALTFIGIPAFAFSKDFSFIHLYFGAIFGRLIIAKVIVPKIYNQGLTLYGIMGKDNSSENGVRLTSLIYVITKLLAVGVRLYAGSILVAEFFKVSIILALVIITTLTFFYTLIGGLKAVVRTDLLQAFLFVFGGITAHFLIPDVAKTSWIDLMQTASLAGKTWVFSLDRFQDFIFGFIGGVLFDMCTHGVDQDFTQRLMGAKSEKTAKTSIFLSSFFSIGVGLLFLSIGSLLFGFYQINPYPAAVKTDEIFAHFITNYFPSPLKGLMLAGVLAATMSTLDSTINALSSVLWGEIWTHRDHKKIKKYLKWDTLIISFLLLVIAVVASESSGILVLGLKIASWSGGALAALFFSQLIWNRVTKSRLDGATVLLSYLFNVGGVALNSFIIKGPWQLNVYFGMIFATLFLVLQGRLFKTS